MLVVSQHKDLSKGILGGDRDVFYPRWFLGEWEACIRRIRVLNLVKFREPVPPVPLRCCVEQSWVPDVCRGRFVLRVTLYL